MVLEVGRGDNRAVREHFQAGITAVNSGKIVKEFNPILSRQAVAKIKIGPDPGYKMTLRGAGGRSVRKYQPTADWVRVGRITDLKGSSSRQAQRRQKISCSIAVIVVNDKADRDVRRRCFQLLLQPADEGLVVRYGPVRHHIDGNAVFVSVVIESMYLQDMILPG